MNAIIRMMSLFVSNSRSIGKYDPKNGKMYTEYRGLTEEDFQLHFSGKVGVGAVPIRDDDMCQWAAIDIDNHDQEDDIPIAPIDEYIRTNGLPLVPCRSKSGGVHVYLFLSEPVRADRVRDTMIRWAAALGYAGSEVFPKQVKLLTTGGKRQLGNWINLPYMTSENTERFCVKSGKKLSLSQFLDYAEKSRVSLADLNALVLSRHGEAPPCVQRMMADGVEKGRRNEAMYNTVVYLRKFDGDEYAALASELNRQMFDFPLSKAELSRTVQSASKPDYKYRCNEEPIKSLCDRAVCVKRRFGVTEHELERVDATGALPEFSDLVQIGTDPPRWELTIDGKYKVLNLTTAELLDFRQMRLAIMERLLRVVPSLKSTEWERILSSMMENVRKVEAPEDASPGGIVREKLRDYINRINMNQDGLNLEDRKALLRGIPVLQMYEGERMIMFRGSDFMQYLKRTKAEVLKDINLWLAIRAVGGVHRKIRIGAKTQNVWAIPANTFDFAELEPPQFTTEL